MFTYTRSAFDEMKRFLFFDLDGTLTDPALGITNSIMYALKTYGIDVSDRESLYPFIGPPLVDSFAKYYGFSRERGFEATDRFREYFSEKGIFENRLYEGIPELLASLKENGFCLVLATSKPEKFALRILEHFQIREYFAFVCGASMDEKVRSKKDDVIRYALETSGADPKKSVMIGDREYDVLGGKRFGMKTVGVLYGYGSRGELERAGADRICENVAECLEVLLSCD